MSLEVIFSPQFSMYGDQPRREGFNIVEWDGWDNGVDVRQEKLEVPGGDGDFDLPSTLASRIVPFSGYCMASNAIGQVSWYGDMLTGLLSRRLAFPITVKTLDRSLMSFGKLAAKPEFEPFGGQKFADFAGQLYFPDHRRFGPTQLVEPGKPMRNYGNAITAPRFRITGARPGGYTINGPAGRQYVVTAPLVAGHPHTIDMLTGRLSINGIEQDDGTGRIDIWGVPGGGEVMHTITGAGAILEQFERDTYN